MIVSRRQLWVVVHRWAGLTIALFLIVAGATGAILPWQEELTLAGRPALSRVVPPSSNARVLDPATLAERVERQTSGSVSFLPLTVPNDHVATMFVASREGGPALPFDAVWVDPFTGKVRLAFRYAVLADGAQNIVPFLYRVHYSLAAGEWGIWAFGVAALVWTLDCFVGLYLTFPLRRKAASSISGGREPGPSWWTRWRPAWTIRKGAHGHKLNFDLHRAGGLWLWPLLLVFAWSSVGFCLPSVHRPVMKALGGTDDFSPVTLPSPVAVPRIDRREAIKTGARLLAARGMEEGFDVAFPAYLSYDRASAAYRYSARTDLDQSTKDGQTTLWFDGRSGRMLALDRPLGRTGTDAVMSWAYLLHMARVFGLPYRILVSLTGLAVVTLSVTGVLIWTKKRSARLLGKKRARRSSSGTHPGMVAAE